ncbi:uncharacterized protein K452DRAFT_350771 [Aplosporella prunicola CBS 121167]|uniref:Pentacotripeptide-repeat region of PRORP domain-containing protein n=1 Tax=Aplosporella prunicola CBS 121167 TaxID=1176127 RepID=A0A6A6BGH5_9PEZI|nr:uncharacterized protein K452DRAFT_350771 [Aplosporella prunicola CBS 121167]KAF2142374.1 hypothetical protein K452DRAFT_350771 [Aplosporella prunicola CBS 121167]
MARALHLPAARYPSPDEAHRLYTSISYPRVAYLHYSTIRRLLNCLSAVEYPTEAAMVRYLAVIDDMKATNIPVHFMDWRRCYRRVTNAEVGSALLIWREMEQEAGVRASHITFNILFDIASKAGKYQLATMISKEMERRKMEFDRHFRAGMIMLCGMKGDGEAVRKAYRDLVDAGEIIDTAIMNCVLTALLHAGEPTAAEQVFTRMKRMHNDRQSPRSAPADWRQQRELGKLLRKAATELREDPEGRQLLQDESPVGPDYGTYKVLISHYACTAGNIDRVIELIEEMTGAYGISMRGDMYFRLFDGFEIHGGVRYSSWTKAKLESTWEAFLSALDEEDTNFFLSGRFVVKIIYAYAKVTSTARTIEVWEEIQQRWQPSNADKDTMSKIVRKLFPDEV